LSSGLGWLNRWIFGKITARVEDLRQREKILAAGGPSWLIALLVSWLVCLLLGYALLLWPLNHHTFPLSLEEAGSSLFTLGFVRPFGAGPVAVVFLAGASGLALVALLIAYLPTLYTAFNRREISVTMLEALAGSPPWGPELLARQALVGDVAYLPKVYERWTEWAADIAESHTNYRTLAYFRSPDPQTSWLLGLLAVLDAAALQLALNPGTAPAEARPLMRVGYITMRRLARNLGMTVTEDPHPDDPLVLTKAEYDMAVDRIRRAGWVFEREPDEAWPHFHGCGSTTRPRRMRWRASSTCPRRCGRAPAPGTARRRSCRCARRTANPASRWIRNRGSWRIPMVVLLRRGRAEGARPPRSRARPPWWRSSTGAALPSRTRSSRPGPVRACRNRRWRAGCRW
jgi:hypothetical protein